MPDSVIFPETLSTARLELRVPRAADGPLSAQAINDNLEHLRPWMPWAQSKVSAEQQTESMARAHDRFLRGEELMYLIFRRQQLIGSCGIHRIRWEVPCGDIGYWLDQRAQGQGYATEVAGQLTHLALGPAAEGGLGFERLEIRCDARNTSSAAVAKRLGYQSEACLKRSVRSAGPPHDLRDLLVFARWPA